MSQQHVLVTGGSGFIAGHCILQLLDQGHTVRATLRSLAKQDAARPHRERIGKDRGEKNEDSCDRAQFSRPHRRR